MLKPVSRSVQNEALGLFKPAAVTVQNAQSPAEQAKQLITGALAKAEPALVRQDGRAQLNKSVLNNLLQVKREGRVNASQITFEDALKVFPEALEAHLADTLGTNDPKKVLAHETSLMLFFQSFGGVGRSSNARSESMDGFEESGKLFFRKYFEKYHPEVQLHQFKTCDMAYNISFIPNEKPGGQPIVRLFWTAHLQHKTIKSAGKVLRMDGFVDFDPIAIENEKSYGDISTIEQRLFSAGCDVTVLNSETKDAKLNKLLNVIEKQKKDSENLSPQEKKSKFAAFLKAIANFLKWFSCSSTGVDDEQDVKTEITLAELAHRTGVTEEMVAEFGPDMSIIDQPIVQKQAAREIVKGEGAGESENEGKDNGAGIGDVRRTITKYQQAV